MMGRWRRPPRKVTDSCSGEIEALLVLGGQRSGAAGIESGSEI
jgi:hypothetical protein